MTAWLIVTAHVTDREGFMAGYAPAAAALVEKFGGRYVVRAPGAQQLEGTGGGGASVVVSEWPDKAAALSFWNSAEYAAVKRLREGKADVSVLLV
ncbi:DUF1330 domain-containing protein [Novosphingobium sp. Gsoil 351]|uniref:DUF1330 domain-containing protein n=1 Tax=Novosphingobium sp. Gsoil 351 TaxID=2675225 RepID=UPI0012B49C09|nr:DUF1330 domain-containing protein [Novosphingobium sp. Gsoil 351]QGN54459.1 DUF1330 domain-containing protein [Novosphingobium sp. Gsoil 351]